MATNAQDPILHEDPDSQSGDEESQRKVGAGWTGWLISGSFHALLVLVLSGVYWLVKQPDVEPRPVRTVTIDPPTSHDMKPPEVHEPDSPVQFDTTVVADTTAPITDLVPVDSKDRDEQVEDPNPKGREEAVADSEMGGPGAFLTLGAGPLASGLSGIRTGAGKQRLIGKGGGSCTSENSVKRALNWFKRHQDADGGWDPVKYQANCSENPKCEPGDNQYTSPAGADAAMTGYVLLCFLGAGYDQATPNLYRSVVKRGLDHLIAIQSQNGWTGDRNYVNAIASMALAEAFAMTGDPALKQPAQTGIDLMLKRQNQLAADPPRRNPGVDPGYGTGLGWDYQGPDNRNDSSVTGWHVMALKSGMAAQLNIGSGMEGAKKWLELTWKKTNPEWAKLDPYTGESRFPYTYMTDTEAVDIAAAPAPGAPSGDAKELTCVGAVCAVFLGHHAGDPMLETMANYIMAHETPASYPCNTYKLYYNTMAMFQVGGPRWRTWNSQVRDLLVGAQRKDQGCLDGSWDSAGTRFVGSEIGRVLSTAYCCLSLEVYYRYAQVAGPGKK